MELKVAWWNCRLSPPSTSAKKYDPNAGFIITLYELIDNRSVDVLGLCEVDDDNIEWVRALLDYPEYSHLRLVSLYSKSGNSVEDFCLIYNSEKLMFTGETKNLNTRGSVLNERLKAGVLCRFLLGEKPDDLYVVLCHWQSRNTYAEGSVERDSLGAALRESLNQIGVDRSLIVICGDFNDEPFSDSVQKKLGASRDAAFVAHQPKVLFNPYWNCLGMLESVDSHPLASGTCYYKNDHEYTHWKTFDQIIFSSGFLRDGWKFIDGGAEVVNSIGVNDLDLEWIDVSDHYPVLSHLQRVIL